jgi:biuret amidohydrolase
MPLSFDRSRTALVLCDYNNDIVHPDGKFAAWGLPAEAVRRDVVARAKQLLAAARAAALPVIHVSAVSRDGAAGGPRNADAWRSIAALGALTEGTWGAELHEDLRPLPGEMVVLKRRVSAFYHTDLQLGLRELGADTLILCGVATTFVVEGTARDAADAGYTLIIVEDCCSSGSEEMHKASLTAMSMITTITTSADVRAALGAPAEKA